MVYENADGIRDGAIDTYDMFLVFFKDRQPKAVVHVVEGSGDNLDEADREEGYVDYADYQIFRDRIPADEDEAEEGDDGGMVMMKKPYADYRPKELARLFEDELKGDTEFDTIALCGNLDDVGEAVGKAGA